jgi:CheY-like chemotaxis protein
MRPNLASRILLVEPHDDFREVFATLLGLVGYEVKTAGDVNEALATVKTFVPDVVITELRLADNGGLELARKLRLLSFGNDLILVALCSYVQPHSEAEALQVGFHCFLAKPVSVERIVTVLQSLAETKDSKAKRWLH